jgi:flagellar motility protein MotE (MotC chaperone)
MRNVPRILPLVGVAVGGVLAINALSGAQALPDLLSGAKALAEDAKPEKAAKDHKGAKDEKGGEAAATGEAKDAAAQKPAMPVMPGLTPKPAAVCAPTAAELAREAGLSPAELQVLQSLGTRRGQLDQREQQLDVQLALMAAAEAKVDAKLKALNGLKADINGLLKQADAKEDAEVDRLVKVFEAMKPKDAAPRIVLLDDSVRLPIAAKMKERALSAILANMPAPEAKKLTEALARRFATARAMAEDVQAKAKAAEAAAAAAPAAKTAEAKPPAKPAAKRAGPRKTAQAAKPAAPADAGQAGEAPAPKAG